MAAIRIPDVSEFQDVAWDQLAADVLAIIVRLYSGWRADFKASIHLAGARQRCRVRGWYCYLVAARDAVAQADAFCDVLLGLGGLQPGEFITVDDEEGPGDQSGRVTAFLARCDARLRTPHPDGQDWWYSGLKFAVVHNLPAARGHRWVAAYGQAEPDLGHDLWQSTDAATVAGISTPCDCSLYHGSIDDLYALVGGDELANSDEILAAIKSVYGLFADPSGTHPETWIRQFLEGEKADFQAKVAVVTTALPVIQNQVQSGMDVLQDLKTALAALKATPGGVIDLSGITAAVATLDSHMTVVDGHIGSLREHLGDQPTPSS